MGPEKWKGELPPDEPAERDAEPAQGEAGREAGGAERVAHRSIEEREDEGYDQPESSAQKGPPPGPGEGEGERPRE